MSSTSAYQEFTGKSVEEALRLAREAFGVGLDDLDFEILSPGSRGVLGMGAEPARVLAAPRSELGGASLELAERTVHKELADDSARSATVDSFLSEIENLPSPRGRQVAAGGGA